MPSTSISPSPDGEPAPAGPPRRRRGAAVAIGLVAVAAGVLAVLLDPGGDATGGEDLMDPLSGGEGTVSVANRQAFGKSARNLSNEQRRTFAVGDSFFTQKWVTAPASTEARDGLGPLHNAPACASCHVHDGRAQPPVGEAEDRPGLLLRLSIGGDGDRGPDPVYGDQIQDRAILEVAPEAEITVEYEEVPGVYPDGTGYSLREPRYHIDDLGYGPLAPDIAVSPRIAPPVIGVGLLEAIPEETVLERADPDDGDGDGISGRPNYVQDPGGDGLALGRFGWKATVTTVRRQTAAAFRGDLGVTSTPFPDESCTTVQRSCLAAPGGGTPEIEDDRLDQVAFYTSTLAVPARRHLEDPDVATGAERFAEIGCEACHRSTVVTGDHEIGALAGQEIHPFTDLLLHDMGEGLADGRPDVLASGSEWRTPPLWGIGLTETVNDHTNFLHDGRARSLEEAILWHGGEAAASRDRFTELPAGDRARVIDFLESL